MQTKNIVIEDVLSQYEYTLGKDFEKYRNHVYRVYNICISLDTRTATQDKYAIAAVFHDIGIWTEKDFDYLEPSIALAHNYLLQVHKVEWNEEIELMIDMHHKRSSYKGIHEDTVEVFRKADWIDVTKSKKSFGFDTNTYKMIVTNFPLLGFHKFLILQTIKNFIKSPFNPLLCLKND